MTIGRQPSSSQVEIAIYKPSYDGQYWGRYPNGDKPGPNMFGSASVGSSASAALSTSPAPMMGAATVSSAVSGILSTSSSNQIKFNPGHYMVSNSRTFSSNGNLSQRNIEIDLVKAAGPNVLGYMPYYQWGVFEPTSLGVYTWAILDADYTRLTGIAHPGDTPTGKHLCIELMMDVINSLTGSNIVPAYVFNNPGTYGSGLNSGGGTANGGGNGVVALWRTAVMDRVIALVQAILNHVMPSGLKFNDDPWCEGIISWELTSQTAAIGSSDASMASLTTQIKRWAQAAVAAATKTLVSLECNYFGSPAETLAMMQFIQANRLGAGGPDIWGATCMRNQAVPSNHTSMNNLTWGQQCLCGVATTTYPSGNPDLRGTLPIMHEIQEPEMDGVQFSGIGSPFVPQDINDCASQILSKLNNQGGVTHLFWACLDPGVNNRPAVQDPNTKKNTGSFPGNWWSVLQMINQNPIAFTGLPSNLH